MFFVILISNLFASGVDFLAIMFPGLEELINIPTTSSDFNIAMAIVSVGLVLYLQLKKMGRG